MKYFLPLNHQIWKRYVNLLLIIIAFSSPMFLSCMGNGNIRSSMDDGLPTEIPLKSDMSANNSESFLIEVVKILDINQIEIMRNGVNEKIKLIGVDISDISANPELELKAMSFMRFVLEGETITLEEEPSLKSNAYKNSRYVFVDGMMLNRELLIKGFAKFFNDVSIKKYRDVLELAEDEAISRGLGVWGIGKSSNRKGVIQDQQQMGCGTLPCNPNRP